MTQPAVVVAQIGRRQHYAIPQVLHDHGALARLVTDIWNPFGPWFTALARASRFKPLIRFAGRRPEGIARSQVVAVCPRALLGRVLGVPWSRRDTYLRQIELERHFALGTLRHLDVSHDAFYSFCGQCLEVLRSPHARGLRTIVDQVDAAATHELILHEEEKRFPHLVLTAERVPPEYYHRLQAEWDSASVVLVNSAWSRQALLSQGVPSQKIAVMPIIYRGNPGHVRRPAADGLKVLWLGRLSLAKGLPYAVQAAALLARAPVRFTIVGPAEVNVALLKLPDNCAYVGHVPRIEAHRFFNSHDLFLFPTLSDGFGIVQLEAMAAGMPVIATPCCGEVVEHGRSGWIVEARSAAAIADAIRTFLDSPDLLPQMSSAALSRSLAFRPEALWPRFRAVLTGESAG